MRKIYALSIVLIFFAGIESRKLETKKTTEVQAFEPPKIDSVALKMEDLNKSLLELKQIKNEKK